MNKIAIPAILAATILIAGIFAFAPMEQASTVHTSGTITLASDADIDAILADTTALQLLITAARMAELDAANLPTDIADLQMIVSTFDKFYLYVDEIITTVDNAANEGQDTSIAIGTDDLPVISYSDNTNTALKVAHCNDAACTSAGITTLDSAVVVGTDTSIAIGADNLPVISYRDDTNTALKVAHCNDPLCSLVL